MSCNDTSSNKCFDFTYATCVDYEGELGQNTKITKDCVSQSDVNKDLYEITDDIISSIDLSGLNSYCLSYPLVDGKVTLQTVTETHAQEICNLKDRVTELENLSNINITGFGLDLKCLTDPCGDPITTLGPLLQALIDQTCP